MKNCSILTSVAVLSMTLFGCTLGTKYQAPQTTMEAAYMNANSDETTKAHDRKDWWASFDDPILNQLVWDAQHQNISLRMASERIQMAKNYHQIVESFKLPTVSVGASYYNYQISENTPLIGGAVSPVGIPSALQPAFGESITLADAQQDGLTIGATIAWEADLFGRIDHQVNAAKIKEEQAEIYKQGLYALITAEVIHNYLQVRGTQERKQVLLTTVEDQQKLLGLVEKVVEIGFGSELDLAQARAMLAATESMLPQLEIAEQVHKHRISIILSESLQDIDKRFEQSVPLGEIKGIIPVGIPSELLERRFDIKLAEREMAAVNEEVGVAIAAQYPKFFLTGTPGLSTGSFDELFSSGSFGWIGSVGIRWNIFDAGRGEAVVAFNEARFKSAVLSYHNTVESSFKEVDSLLFTYGKSQENNEKLNEALKASEVAVKKAKSLNEVGLIDSIAVLDAQRGLNAMKDKKISAKLQTVQVIVSLYKALGGDWNIVEGDDSEES
ncbi:efflux transporter outer membrane subunit [Moritella sp. 5]|nr:efflux transporter outer membrane subunit [Moritella sp. 5]